MIVKMQADMIKRLCPGCRCVSLYLANRIAILWFVTSFYACDNCPTVYGVTSTDAPLDWTGGAGE